MVYSDLNLEVDSVVVKDRILNAVVLCASIPRDMTQCQVLANLCALQLYATAADACIEYRKLANAAAGAPTNGWEAWPESLPWLEYSSTDMTSYKDDLTLVATMGSADADSGSATNLAAQDGDAAVTATSNLRFVAAVYTLDGAFVAFEELSTQLQLCDGEVSAWTTFGTNTLNKCVLSLRTGFSQQPRMPLFYEPYIVDGPSGDLYPVPVMLRSGQRDAVAARRFFTYDNVTADSGGGELNAVRVLTTAKVTVVLRDTQGHIEPPQITVSYSDYAWPPAEGATVSVSFAAEYSQDQSSYVLI